mgnify:CR=1 FL=1
MTTPTIRKPYDRVRLIADIPSDSKTVTDAGNDTDINRIVARFRRTGVMPTGNQTEPQYGDVTALQGDLTELIEKGKTAQAALDKLQSEQNAANKKKSEENAEKLKKYEELLAKQQQNQQPTSETQTVLPDA